VNRRSFLGILGIAPLALIVVPSLSAEEPKRLECGCLNLSDPNAHWAQSLYGRVRDWAPNTAYNIGDRVHFSNGQVVTVTMAGTSASVEMINGTIVPLKGRF
jgi:hypothetical protein